MILSSAIYFKGNHTYEINRTLEHALNIAQCQSLPRIESELLPVIKQSFMQLVALWQCSKPLCRLKSIERN